MARLMTKEDSTQFWVKHDATMMREALDELDSFVEHPPCYTNRRDQQEIGSPAA
jgi:hypothetical protein